MKIRLIAVGRRMPSWVAIGFGSYADRLQGKLSLELIEVVATKRGPSSSTAYLRKSEAGRIVKVIPDGAWVVALDERGNSWDSKGLAKQMETWLTNGVPVALLIGGPDGLDRALLTQANEIWSLSALTLPHGLVRVVVAEQLYRAWSMLNNHPYHRD